MEAEAEELLEAAELHLTEPMWPPLQLLFAEEEEGAHVA